MRILDSLLAPLSPLEFMRNRSPLSPVFLAACLSLFAACGGESSQPASGNPEQSAGAVQNAAPALPVPAEARVVELEVPALSAAPVPGTMDEIALEWAEELTRLQELTNANLDSAGSWLDLGMGYEKSGMREHALLCYGQAQRLDPEDPKSWYRSGNCHWRLGDLPKALEHYARVQALEPGYAPCHYRKGIIEMDMGSFDAAWDTFLAGTRADPAYVGCHLGLARILVQRDELQPALEILETLYERNPGDIKVNNLMVTAAHQAGLETERVLQETPYPGDTPDPSWGDPWQLELASFAIVSFKATVRAMLRTLGQAESALELMKERRLKQPDDWSYVGLHAQALFQLKRLDEVDALYREFLTVEPNNVNARLQLAYFQDVAGTPEQGIPWLDQALRIDPKNKKAWTAKGRMLSAAQQYAASLPVLEKGLELDPNSMELMYWMLNTLAGLQRWEETLPIFDKYLKEKPEDAEIWLDLSRARIKLRSFGAAEDALNRAVELNVGRPAMVDRLRELVERRKQRVREIEAAKQ